MCSIVCLALCLSAPTEPIASSPSVSADLQWQGLLGTVRILNRTGNQVTATGVVVGHLDAFAYVLTAEHAVPEGDERELHIFTKESYPLPSRTFGAISVVVRVKDPDLAILKVPVGAVRLPSVPIAGPGQRPRRFPQDVIIIGCDDGSAPICKSDQIQAKKLVRYRDGSLRAFFWETAQPPNPGRSGGPMINAQGRLIGLCSASQSGRGYYTHLDEIQAALKQQGYGWLWERP